MMSVFFSNYFETVARVLTNNCLSQLFFKIWARNRLSYIEPRLRAPALLPSEGFALAREQGGRTQTRSLPYGFHPARKILFISAKYQR
jgi:hypothetical protein